jgi:hypothetical protein
LNVAARELVTQHRMKTVEIRLDAVLVAQRQDVIPPVTTVGYGRVDDFPREGVTGIGPPSATLCSIC